MEFGDSTSAKIVFTKVYFKINKEDYVFVIYISANFLRTMLYVLVLFAACLAYYICKYLKD